MQKKPCVRCLLSDIDPTKVYAEVKDYIASIPAEDKVDDETYSARLDLCRECDNLRDGMCSLCGCFCEVRAVKKKAKCPSVPKKW